MMKIKTLRREDGFTLIEVVLGLLIFAFGLLSLAGMQIISIKGNSFSNNLTLATILAQDKMEESEQLSFSDSKLSSGQHNEGTISSTIFTRSYSVQDVSSTMKAITVIVQWGETGNHSISLSTLINLKLKT
jgi:type IV pilus assembly protein PilV